jgi:hypothetical protein
MYWHDYAVIKLSNLFESLNKIGLVKSFDAQLRLWVNTGTVNVTVSDPAGNATGYNVTLANNTFSDTCPIMINYAAGASGIVPTGTKQIVAGLYVKAPPTDPQKSIDYAQPNRNKKVIYRAFETNCYIIIYLSDLHLMH